jgi:3-dehydroquinate dehydratase-2
MNIMLINGPNLNLLGERESSFYGTSTLSELEGSLQNYAQENDCNLSTFQSNSEGAIIDKIHECSRLLIDAIIINPAGYTHTSIAIRDALLAVNIEFYEVHISNIYQRGEFRHKSYINDIAKLSFVGDGIDGYKKALASAIKNFKED